MPGGGKASVLNRPGFSGGRFLVESSGLSCVLPLATVRCFGHARQVPGEVTEGVKRQRPGGELNARVGPEPGPNEIGHALSSSANETGL